MGILFQYFNIDSNRFSKLILIVVIGERLKRKQEEVLYWAYFYAVSFCCLVSIYFIIKGGYRYYCPQCNL